MEGNHKGKKKGLKLWRCRSSTAVGEVDVADHRKRKRRMAPEGCFSVYVGAERRRFVIRAERASHPLFKMLLDEAESEYGYNSRDVLWLPCKVDAFYRVLKKMDDGFDVLLHGYGYPKLNAAYHLFSPSRWME